MAVGAIPPGGATPNAGPIAERASLDPGRAPEWAKTRWPTENGGRQTRIYSRPTTQEQLDGIRRTLQEDRLERGPPHEFEAEGQDPVRGREQIDRAIDGVLQQWQNMLPGRRSDVLERGRVSGLRGPTPSQFSPHPPRPA